MHSLTTEYKKKISEIDSHDSWAVIFVFWRYSETCKYISSYHKYTWCIFLVFIYHFHWSKALKNGCLKSTYSKIISHQRYLGVIACICWNWQAVLEELSDANEGYPIAVPSNVLFSKPLFYLPSVPIEAWNFLGLTYYMKIWKISED